MPQNPELELLPVEVERVLPFRDSAAVVLKLPEKRFMIFVGPAEAAAIMREMRGERTERPLTHDLIAYLVQGFDIEVKKVVISSIVNNVFCATLVLEQERGEGEEGARNEVRLDVRASDSMVIALKTSSQIWVTRRVLDAVEDVTETLRQIDEQIAAAKAAAAEMEDEGEDQDPSEDPFGLEESEEDPDDPPGSV